MDHSPSGLTTTSYAVLAQLAVRPWSTYELAQQRVRYFRYVWPRAESAIYREVKRLAAMRLVAAKREYVGKRPRTLYSITDAGRQTLREWLATPVSPFAMDFEAMIRLFIAPLGTKEQLVATLEQVRNDAQEMLRFGGAVKQEFLDGRAALQDQVYIRAHAVDFFISLLTTVDDWADRTLAEIEGWKDLSPDGKNDRGLEIFAQLPVPTPREHTDRTPLPPRTRGDGGRRRRRSSPGPRPCRYVAGALAFARRVRRQLQQRYGPAVIVTEGPPRAP
jgi:PadR family transcriptional regulator, regulatory protein AphA